MKEIIYLSVLTAVAFNLTACYKQSDILGGGEYLSNKDGSVLNCEGKLISTKLNPSDADKFWRDNNLPKGTANFVCKDGKAYLPDKVTDCQGNVISKRQDGLKGFQVEHNLSSNGNNIFFGCSGSQVKIVPINFG